MRFSAITKKIIFLSALLLLIQGCQDSTVENTASNKGQNSPKTIEIASLDELMSLFDRLNYNRKSWQEGSREVPRLIFDNVHEGWKETSNIIPVQQKKAIFFRLMAPLILMSNENILATREQIEEASLNSPQLLKLAAKYKVISSVENEFEESHRQRLLKRVDTLPPSLVLAQAAEESGWGTSRFAIEGNSFFGQWDFSGNGMVPAKQRKELGNYGLARFEYPLDSVKGYMLNINSHPAYEKLRELRAKLHASHQPVTGLVLAGTLDKYSERGQAYIEGLREMIRYNGLDQVDDAYLSDKQILRLVRAGE